MWWSSRLSVCGQRNQKSESPIPGHPDGSDQQQPAVIWFVITSNLPRPQCGSPLIQVSVSGLRASFSRVVDRSVHGACSSHYIYVLTIFKKTLSWFAFNWKYKSPHHLPGIWKPGKPTQDEKTEEEITHRMYRILKWNHQFSWEYKYTQITDRNELSTTQKHGLSKMRSNTGKLKRKTHLYNRSGRLGSTNPGRPLSFQAETQNRLWLAMSIGNVAAKYWKKSLAISKSSSTMINAEWLNFTNILSSAYL